ncbi:GGDEF domain-containing protein [Deinococcus peraridilitoris]|uniref:GGDEF domain-containing protein n=1 Tax=Deinococcus peraridilitoris TaxID=432329 RepID=UPI0002FFF7F6|nr:GGDEF domain-containing protein [Deinococcus peraridilitoris]
MSTQQAPSGQVLSSVARAQKLRLKRTGLGIATHCGGVLIVLACSATGMLDWIYTLHYILVIMALYSLFVGLIVSNRNLRFRDPSMTSVQVIVTMWPAAYVMFFMNEPQARVPFLLMGVVGTLFGVFALSFRRMLLVGGCVFACYLALVASLFLWAPERVDLRIEGVSALAFAVVLLLTVYVGSYLAGLRKKLRERNARLEETNVRLEQAMEELRELATRDPLTRLPNRRSALERLAQEKSRALRRLDEGGGLCVGLLDIDHFKRVNDTYGHHVGDAVLCRVSETLQSTLRQDEFVGRYGGEEFLIILGQGAPTGALAAAERLRVALQALQIEGYPGPPVTVSLGLTFQQPGETLEVLLERADRALYHAKAQGRDRAVLVVEDSTGLVDRTEAPVTL